MPRQLFKILRTSAGFMSVSAAVNVVTAILTIKLLGETVYADFIVDLAQLSLLLILVETLPSSFVVYKIQDDPRWLKILKLHIFTTFTLIPVLVLALDTASNLFDGSSYLVAAYTMSVVLQRFNDIRLQASGNIQFLFVLDLATATLRLLLLFLFHALSLPTDQIVWGSLAIAGATVQISGFIKLSVLNTESLSNTSFDWTLEIRKHQKIIFSYYPTIALKRTSDAAVPVLAAHFIASSVGLATFLLAFKCFAFVNGISRVFEAILSNRSNLATMKEKPISYFIILGALNHSFCFFISIIVAGIAYPNADNSLFLFLLSTAAWPTTAILLLRSKHYSQYSTNGITVSYFVFFVIFYLSLLGASLLWETTPTTLALSYLLGQTASSLILVITSNSSFLK